MPTVFPALVRRGGRAIKKKSPFENGADGAVCSTARSHLVNIREALLIDRCASRLSIRTLRAAPPNLGGE